MKKNIPVFCAILLFASILLMFGDHNGRWRYKYQLNYLSDSLKARSEQPVDVLANIVGFRRLVENRNAYPRIGPALEELGVHWNVRHAHTHPPTAFLLVAPISYLPVKLSLTVWTYLMIGCIFVSMLMYGFSWRWSLFWSALSLFWSPVILSFGQITLIWMLGIAVAFKYRNTNSFMAGIGIGIASITKFLPLLALFPFFLKKKITAGVGCALIWSVSLAIVLALNHSAVFDYLTANRGLAGHAAARLDNASLVMGFYREYGFLGFILLGLFISGIYYINRYDFLNPAQISARCFMFFSWLSVILLPIAWVYSMAPLLPLLIYFLLQKNVLSTVLCLFIAVLPNLYRPFGDKFVIVFYLCTLLSGLLFISDRLPGKYFQLNYGASLKNVFD